MAFISFNRMNYLSPKKLKIALFNYNLQVALIKLNLVRVNADDAGSYPRISAVT